jgi:OmpA-OmpF porin, OOP family
MITEFVIASSLMLLASLNQDPVTQVILLPNEDGHQSIIEVNTHGQQVAINTPYQVVEVSQDNQSTIVTTTAQEVTKRFGELIQRLPAKEQQFVLFFKPGGADLTDESTGTLNDLLQMVSQRAGGELVIVGHTDRQGDADKNDALSKKRAGILRERVAATGFDAQRIQAFGRGEREPLVPTEDGIAEAKNRRAVVIVR